MRRLMPPRAAKSPWPVLLGNRRFPGAAALGAEVVWTRLLGMMFGGTVYAFSTILAVFLVGLGLGSFIGALVLRVVKARPALAWCQILLAGGIAWATYMITRVLPYMPEPRSLNGWEVNGTNLLRAAAALLPAALLWGASFPLAIAAARHGADLRETGIARLCGQHLRRHCRGTGCQPGADWLDRHPRHRTGDAGGGGAGRVWRCCRAWRAPLQATTARWQASAMAMQPWWRWRPFWPGSCPTSPANVVAFGKADRHPVSPYSKILEVVEGRNSSIAITRVNDNFAADPASPGPCRSHQRAFRHAG